MKINKKIFFALIASLALATVIANAALPQLVTTTIYFSTASTDAMVVRLLDDGTAIETVTAAVLPGQAATNNIEFSSATGDTLWDNCRLRGNAAANQSDGTPCFTVDNTGTSTLNVVMNQSKDDGEEGLGNGCRQLAYSFDWQTWGGGNQTNFTGTVTLDATLTPADAKINVYLVGNFTDCPAGDGVNVTNLFIWALGT